MGDTVLKDFMKLKGLIKEEPKPQKKVEKKQICEELNLGLLDNSISFKEIIEKKPSRKKVVEYLKNKMELYEKEFLD